MNLGEVSAARDNNVCGVGVAYDSLVAGNKSHTSILQITNLYKKDIKENYQNNNSPVLIGENFHLFKIGNTF